MEDVKDWYFTLEGNSEGFLKEKGSKFLGFAFPVATEAEIESHLAALKKKYYDARHYCYAYRLGFDGQVFRANDDGEPSNSAGIPILGQIRSCELTNVLVVVVRYFGGIKLGVGGLVQAYKTAALDALQNAAKKEVIITDKIKVVFGYERTNEVMRTTRDFQVDISSQAFTEICEVIFEVRKRESGRVFKYLEEIYDIDVSWLE